MMSVILKIRRPLILPLTLHMITIDESSENGEDSKNIAEKYVQGTEGPRETFRKL